MGGRPRNQQRVARITARPNSIQGTHRSRLAGEPQRLSCQDRRSRRQSQLSLCHHQWQHSGTVDPQLCCQSPRLETLRRASSFRHTARPPRGWRTAIGLALVQAPGRSSMQRTRRQYPSRHERGNGSARVKLRKEILNRDQHLCQPCLKQGRPTPATEVDHIKPKAQDGTDDPDNLQAICSDCHGEKTRQENRSRGGKQAIQYDAKGLRPRFAGRNGCCAG